MNRKLAVLMVTLNLLVYLSFFFDLATTVWALSLPPVNGKKLVEGNPVAVDLGLEATVIHNLIARLTIPILTFFWWLSRNDKLMFYGFSVIICAACFACIIISVHAGWGNLQKILEFQSLGGEKT